MTQTSLELAFCLGVYCVNLFVAAIWLGFSPKEAFWGLLGNP
jgi:hypothetical protein